MSMLLYPREKILELAFAAYRINKSYIKISRPDYAVPSNHVWSNKELIGHTAASTMQTVDAAFPSWVPENFVPIEVNNTDLENVARAHKFFRRYTMLVLGDRLSAFQKDMYQAYNIDECNISHIAYVAYIPQFIEREADDITYLRKIKEDYASSTYLHGKSFQGRVEILKRIPLVQFDMFLYFAGIEGKLVSFGSKEKYEVEALIDITARIKSRDIERDAQLPMTRINYVKVL